MAQLLPSILFDVSKSEAYQPTNGLKKLAKQLKRSFRILLNKDDISETTFDGVDIFVIPAPQAKFTLDEFEALKNFVHSGGSVFVSFEEGGETEAGTNINYFLEEFGVVSNNDSVIRTVYYKYHHPKEVHIANGVVNRDILRASGKHVPERGQLNESIDIATIGADNETEDTLPFVFPHGCTLNAQNPAVTILSTGPISYPANRPVATLSDLTSSGSGRVLTLGSTQIMTDSWIEKEDNSLLMQTLFKWLANSDEVTLNEIDAGDPDIADYQFVPDVQALSNRLKACLHESEELPKDFRELFNNETFSFTTKHIPDAIALYDKLDIQKSPLTLIPPQFETPLPPLQPAIFPPLFAEPLPPSLELFDLDGEFASQKSQLAALANKCQDNDIDFFINEAGRILGINQKLKENEGNPKSVLEHVLKTIVRCKKNQY
eukprot:TRINITY_DN16627_c0_g1_i1.p1 TRINITY_DN16627_c0_g1~~TRINITY_DN16627_c0_g1_i1.p1  ORF type:complete len:433 (-),score=78.84 TRINITY_DN16627_c0_g1_i1:30-1328(-)